MRLLENVASGGIDRHAPELLRQAAEVIEFVGAEPGHQRNGGSIRAVELAKRSLDLGVNLVAVGVDVLAHSGIDDVLPRA